MVNSINEEDKKGFIEHQKQENVRTLSEELIMLLLAKKRSEVTEIIVKEFLKENHIHTTRDDEKSEMWIYHEGIYVPQGKTYVKEFCRLLLKSAYTQHICNEIINKIEVETFIEQEELFVEENINKIPVQNGILNLKTCKIENFTPKYRFFNKLPLIFNPKKSCPNIKKHFKEVLNNKEDIKVMQELFGFALLRDYKFHKATIFNGKGANGKTITIELFKLFVGVENCSNLSLEQLEDQNSFIISDLHKKLLNLCGDLNPTFLKNMGLFKDLVGHGSITANRKFKSSVSFVNYAKFIFSCNEMPRVYDTSDGFWRRWIYIDFPFKFMSEKEIKLLKNDDKKNVKLADENIIEKITTEEEMSGLLNWALEGLHNLLKQKDFSYNKGINEVRMIWERKANSFSAFCMDNLEENYDSSISKEQLRHKYFLYCREHKVKVMGDKVIKNELANKYGSFEDRLMEYGNKISYWCGIKFKEEVSRQEGQGGHLFPSSIGKKTYKEMSKNSVSLSTLSKYQNNNTELLCTKEDQRETFLTDDIEEKTEEKQKTKKYDFLLFLQNLKILYDNSIPVHEIVHRGGSFNFTEKQINKNLEVMKTKGDIFEPKPGFIGVLE